MAGNSQCGLLQLAAAVLLLTARATTGTKSDIVDVQELAQRLSELPPDQASAVVGQLRQQLQDNPALRQQLAEALHNQMKGPSSALEQLSHVKSELVGIHNDDTQHVQRLQFNVDLRDNLTEALTGLHEQLATHNAQLATDIDTISSMDSNKHHGAVVLETQSSGSTVPGMPSLAETGKSPAEVVGDIKATVRALVDKAGKLRASDGQQVSNLKRNAATRHAVSKQMARVDEIIAQDSSAVLDHIREIKQLAKQHSYPSSSMDGMADAQVDE